MTSLIQQNASANIYVPEQFAMSLLVFCVIQYISNTHTYTLYVYIYLLYIVNICKYNIYEYNHRYIHISIYIYLAYMCHRNICIYISLNMMYLSRVFVVDVQVHIFQVNQHAPNMFCITDTGFHFLIFHLKASK